MRALSVRAPWWWFILHGWKDVENRNWRTSFRGRVLIHASKWYVHRDVVDDIWRGQDIASYRRMLPASHPYDWLKASAGCIVGSVEIVDCVSQSDSPWFFGRYGLVLRNPLIFADPVPFKGSLGFFNVPEGLIGDAA